MPFDNLQIDKGLMHLAIEETLKRMGNGVFDKVGNKLYKKHKCYFSDCLEHPEYLKDVLQEIFGNASVSIIDSITNYLSEYSNKKSISNFLVQISK